MKRIMSNKRAFAIIENFARSRVLVVGDIMADHFIWGKVSRISPEAPVPVVEVVKDNFMPGGCANVQNNIFAMEGLVHLAGVVGSDETGRRLLTEFRSRGVDTEGIVVETGRPTTLKTRIVAHGQQVVRFDREERKPVQAKSIRKILSYIESLRDDLGALVRSSPAWIQSSGIFPCIRVLTSSPPTISRPVARRGKRYKTVRIISASA
jgi:rfaE bifunctional protein kinase chain/domain